jgi:transposase
MRTRRSFSNEFKSKVLEEILSESTTIGAQSRKYNIAYQMVVRWKQDYLEGKLDKEPCMSTDAGYKHKIEQLERMVGQLTMDNELLKKALKSSSNHQKSNGKFSEIISPLTKTFGGGVK